jgi:hypothetical protein
MWRRLVNVVIPTCTASCGRQAQTCMPTHAAASIIRLKPVLVNNMVTQETKTAFTTPHSAQQQCHQWQTAVSSPYGLTMDQALGLITQWRAAPWAPQASVCKLGSAAPAHLQKNYSSYHQSTHYPFQRRSRGCVAVASQMNFKRLYVELTTYIHRVSACSNLSAHSFIINLAPMRNCTLHERSFLNNCHLK